ncbi:MAG TPA: ParM/StbA family protein, partial [Anaerolineales bacterium]
MITLGFDMGMGALKLWGASGGLQLVSQVATNGRAHLIEGSLGLKNRTRPTEVKSDFGSFYVGLTAHAHGQPVENLSFDRLTGTPEMRALLYGALAQYQDQYGPFDDSLSLIVGLPLQMMTGIPAEQYKENVRAWLAGTHEFTANGCTHRIEIARVRQASQPVGALFDYVLDEDSRMIRDRGSALLAEVGVISVGFNTVEVLVVKDQKPEEGFTQGYVVGVRRLLELINHDELYSLGELDEMLRSGGLGTELEKNVPIWFSQVEGVIDHRWRGNSYKRFAKVLIVGGGALLLKKSLTMKFGHKAWMPQDA